MRIFQLGTIKWFSPERGYGFLTGDDGQEIFVHARSLPIGVVPQQSDRVRYLLHPHPDGRLRADRVTLVEAA
jgi:CspA family cold shock protein